MSSSVKLEFFPVFVLNVSLVASITQLAIFERVNVNGGGGFSILVSRLFDTLAGKWLETVVINPSLISYTCHFS